jgi:hypothetical protein
MLCGAIRAMESHANEARPNKRGREAVEEPASADDDEGALRFRFAPLSPSAC